MAQHRHYSPVIDRFLVTCLYHEARERRVPMTRLVAELLRRALTGSAGWQQAEIQHSIREHPSQDRPPR